MPDAPNWKQPHILVLYNENPAWPQVDKDWSAEFVTQMLAGLREQQYTFETLKFFDDLSPLDGYDPRQWLVWNWGEEFAGQPWTEAVVTDALEARGLAYTGASGATLRASQDRLQVKRRLLDAGLPTLPARVFSQPAEAAEWTTYPAIVKGNNQHSSYGIDGRSIVESPAELAERIAYVRDGLADTSLVEQFLDTREFHVAVWGNAQPEALPPLEYDYSAFADQRDRLYTYEWKFDRTSRGFNQIKMPCPAPEDRPDWQARLKALAAAAYTALGLRDYGRVDFRMSGDEPQILDVNANPDLEVTSVLPAGARVLGYSYGQMVDRILRFAAERMPR
jgi:D-alanine-D-alanine ligase